MTDGFRDSGFGLTVSRLIPELSNRWFEVGAKSSAENNGMSTEALDLSFFGVASIWNNDLGELIHGNDTDLSNFFKRFPERSQ